MYILTSDKRGLVKKTDGHSLTDTKGGRKPQQVNRHTGRTERRAPQWVQSPPLYSSAAAPPNFSSSAPTFSRSRAASARSVSFSALS
mmetsp:Transcript_48238/g.156723  ORF Transcript_48238/g.156723 Transcript_48238/m.156723 type:complete len:87 (+) Transcript_48238:782-1042(+)